MKKLTLATLLLLAISFGLLKAQTTKGNILLGASTVFNIGGNNSDITGFGFSSIKHKSNAQNYNEPDPDKLTGFNLSPKVGYFVIDNLALGLNLDYFWVRSKNGRIDSKNTTVVFGAGPFIRYYLPTSKVLPYAELTGGFGTMKETYESDAYDDVTKSSISSLGIGVGVAAPLSDKFTLDVLLGYSSTTIKRTDDNPDKERDVIGAVGIKLGLTYFFSLGSN